MFPLGIETIWSCTFSIPFHTIFYLNSIYQTFYIKDHSCHLKKKITFFPPSPTKLTCSSFSIAIVHLQLLHIYFTMAKWKFTGMVTPNILESMIEYTLILSILDRICEMTTKPLEYPRDPTLVDPLKNLLKIRIWGTKWKRKINKTIEWVAWWWVNAKIDKESLTLFKKTINVPKEDAEDYHCVVFTHAIKFFQECTSLKRPIVEHFFISLLQDLSMEDFVSLGNLLSNLIDNFMQLRACKLGCHKI